MEIRIRNRVAATALALVMAALLATPAFGTRPDDRAGLRGPGQVVTPAPDWFERAAEAAIRDSRSPVVDDRFTIDPTSGQTLLASASIRPDDRGDARGPGGIAVAASAAPSATDSGFEWTTAALGGGLVVLLGVVGGLLIVTGRRFQRHPV